VGLQRLAQMNCFPLDRADGLVGTMMSLRQHEVVLRGPRVIDLYALFLRMLTVNCEIRFRKYTLISQAHRRPNPAYTGLAMPAALYARLCVASCLRPW